MRRQLIETPNGTMTRKKAAAFYGVNLNTLTRRLWRGLPVERAIIPAEFGRCRVWVTPYGRTTLYRLSEILGIRATTLFARVYKLKWKEEDAFNTPAYGLRGHHFILPPAEYRRRLQEVRDA